MLPQNTLIWIIEKISWPLWVLATINRHKKIRNVLLIVLLIGYLLVSNFGWGIIVTIAEFGFRLGFAVMFMVVQFGAMFWFISRTKQTAIYPGDKTAKTFEKDYYGNFGEVKLVRSFVKLMTTERSKLDAIGGKALSGMLLIGPPGVGKTLMMMCLAAEAGGAFFSVSGSGFAAMFIGIGQLKVMQFGSKLRKAAKEYGSAIGFIDEMDAVAGNRGGVVERSLTDPISQQNIDYMISMGTDPVIIEGLTWKPNLPSPYLRSAVDWYRNLSWMDRRRVDLGLLEPVMMGGMGMGGGGLGVASQLLQEMDGHQEPPLRDQIQNRMRSFFSIKPIDPGIVLWAGATNRPDTLDPAFVRAGRLDRKIVVGLPDKRSRVALFDGYLKKVQHEDNIDIELLADVTAGVPHAFIASAIEKEATRMALMDDRLKISQRDIEQAIEESVVGMPNPIDNWEPRQKESVSYHEAGHAVIAWAVRKNKRIASVSVIRRGSGILGYVRDVYMKEVFGRPLAEVSADAMVALAGHEAVYMKLGEHWTGGSSDFNHLDAYMKFLLAHGKFGGIPITDNLVMKKRLDERQDNYQKELIVGTRTLLREHEDKVELVAQALIERDELSSNEFYKLMEERK